MKPDELLERICKLYEHRQLEFETCEDADGSTYIAGYLKALEDMLELMK